MNLYEDLKSGVTTLDQLVELGIKVRHYSDCMVLTYDNFAAPKDHPYVIQSRGVILDQSFNVICRPFDRFYNLGEQGNTVEMIDFDKMEIVEKLDGSIIKIYWDGRMWQIATNGTAMGEARVWYHPMTYREHVLNTLGMTEEQFQIKCMFDMGFDLTYIFEIVSPENLIVKTYDKARLVWLATRRTKTGEYVDTSKSMEKFGASFPAKYKFSNYEECKAYLDEMKDGDEGFIVYSDGKPLCKMKCDEYIRLHHLKGECLTKKKAYNLICSGEMEEYLVYFPNDKDVFDEILAAKEIAFVYMETVINEILEAKMSPVEAFEHSKGWSFQRVVLKYVRDGGDLEEIFNAQTTKAQFEIISNYMED